MNDPTDDSAMFGHLCDGRFQRVQIGNVKESDTLSIYCTDLNDCPVTIECTQVAFFSLHTTFFSDHSIMSAIVYTGPIAAILSLPLIARYAKECSETVSHQWSGKNPHISAFYLDSYGSNLVVVSYLADKEDAFRLVDKTNYQTRL